MIKTDGEVLFYQHEQETLEVRCWGKNAFRVRATQNRRFLKDEILSALTCPAEGLPDRVEAADREGLIVNGKLSCRISGDGVLSFFRDGQLILEEYNRNRKVMEDSDAFNSALEINPRMYEPITGTDYFRITLRFEACDGEKLYGMGQYQQPYLDHKGCILELAHRNSQASVPFLLSSRGYGLLWNNPAIGRVTFGRNVTEWISDSTTEIDYWIVAGDTPAEIEEAYAGVAGTVPEMPEYGLGFWQSKLRYRTQEEILRIAEEYRQRQLPLDVLVIDFYHWTHQGDWKFDEAYWPDVPEMVSKLNEMGIRLMVSVWPTVEEDSENYGRMKDSGYLIRSEHGHRIGQLGNADFFDATNPGARDFVWNRIRENYYDRGIRLFWLDEAEPEYTRYDYGNYRCHAGSNPAAGNIYPREYARMVYEGLKSAGEERVVSLLRCAWAGSQKYGALVWSGDIDSSFRSLRNQLAAGLNMGLAGIPWWTTDIGGFHGGNPEKPEYRECFARWFEFGAFCPVFRLHGLREPFREPLGETGGGWMFSGADNEVWSYGEEVYEICRKYMAIREALRGYIRTRMEEAHRKGTPVIRPLFYDFPQDERAWTVEDQYLFGPDILVCPILYEGLRSRRVYLPEGEWRCLDTGKLYDGQREYTADAPLDSMPVFIRSGAVTGI